jgi:ankyrin repeat protein
LVEYGSKRNLWTWVRSKFSRDEKHFIEAAMKGDVVRVQNMLSRSTNSTLSREAKNKALIEASTNDKLRHDQVNIVNILVDNGAIIDVQGRKSLGFVGAIWQNKNQRRTPLIWAISYGQTQIAETLLSRGAQVEVRDDELGFTPLMWAAYCGYEDIVTLLITSASLEALSDSGMTPLMLAVIEQHDAIVKLLIHRGANVECKDESGMPALCVAAKKGNCNVVQALIDGGADLEARDDVKGRTALIWAIASFKYDVIDLLILKSADKTATDKNGYTAEDWLRGEGLAFIEHVSEPG